MSDSTISARIEQLVDEEHALRDREPRDATHDDALSADRGRLREIEVELDRCWGLLRQRRARRAAGQDPGQALVRDASTVERYLQ